MSLGSEYVVAGATGQVGSVVAGELLERGGRVTVIVRDAARGGSWPERGAKLASGSLDDDRFLTKTLRGADGFFALLPEHRTATDFHGERRRMVDAIASAVRASGIQRVVMISSIGADQAAGNGPVADLHYMEQALRASGAALCAVRSAYFQENVLGLVPLAETAGFYPNFLPSADVEFPTAATRDAGALAAELLAAPAAANEVVDLLGPSYSVRALARALGTALGRTLEVVDVPPPEQVAALVRGGLSESVASAVAEMFAGFASGRFAPAGDRIVRGSTPIEDTLRARLAARRV